ncbi:tRNA epoxyqueuosine(34) reductase QueG [Panacagrimonas sp.]|uniref:tRNA epoxyqueuosine(34) reductase QueG n=1 Tax=Panacagrimonas sp. TaxID=2480088 RepID=UPI003B52DB31
MNDAVATLAQDLRGWARQLGFADAGVAHLELGDDLSRLQRWLTLGYHGSMAYMQRHAELRADPRRLHAGTLSVISVRLPYWPDAADADTVLADRSRAYISRYALGRDYHRVLRARLLRLGRRLEQAIRPHGYRVFADSAPVLEKALARNAGLGWIGKHSLVIQRDEGSWFFLGELFTDLLLPADDAAAVPDGCGRCSACMRKCPTGAIVAPYTVDARRCISYLTIEHHGSIPETLRPLMGNRIFGCDDCQLACPWNRQAQPSRDPDFAPRHGLDAAQLLDLWQWDEAQWLHRTEGMPLRRLDYGRWLRNLAVALGNAPPSTQVRTALQTRAEHADPVVREHVAWALARHQGAGCP